MEILRDRREEFDRVGVKPLGVSRDSPWTHISWMQALDLNFGLLSDWNAAAVRGFGVSRDFRGFSDIARRAAFLVDAEGTVRATWSYEDSEVPDFDQLIQAAARRRRATTFRPRTTCGCSATRSSTAATRGATRTRFARRRSRP